MKNYLIKTNHSIHKYDYDQGELEFINEYQMSETILAETPKKALEKYIDKVLGFSFDVDEIESDENIYFDVLVDYNNFQASTYDVELWKKGEQTLYNDCVYVKIYELNEINFI